MIMPMAERATTKSGRTLRRKSGPTGSRVTTAGKPRHDRVGIPMDPQEYERRRQFAQITVDRYYGPCVYRVVGSPGQMLRMVKWTPSPQQPQINVNVSGPQPLPDGDDDDSPNPASPW